MSILKALRKAMAGNGFAAYWIPGTDPHQSEYLPACWQRRAFTSGFNGSAGELVVAAEKAGLWTDSRYFLQAEQQLTGSGIELQKLNMPETPSIEKWLSTQLKAGDSVGVDPRLMNYTQFQATKTALAKKDIVLISVADNLVDPLWKEQPEKPNSKIEIHDLSYAGKSTKDKLTELRDSMKAEDAGAMVLTTLDSIAWLFNIRGKDVAFNPYVIAYAVVTTNEAFLFVEESQVSREVAEYLSGQGVSHKSYEDFGPFLKDLSSSTEKVWLDPNEVSQWVVDLLEGKATTFFKEDPIILAKAQKNEAELKGFETAHERDGAAMVKFLHWLENAVGKEHITEISAADRLAAFRQEGKHLEGLSFETISGYADHGAIVHYGATPESDVPLKPEGIFLIDSGGQYLEGTTDITRTVPLGNPTNEQKNRYTRVLQGHIALASAKFPAGTTGPALDTLARRPLWDEGLNYMHGTGHGVGAYLGVHEGPQGISYYRGHGVAMLTGMVTSNEPGFYKEGEYGIRIENLIVVKEVEGTDGAFLRFKTITWCPIDVKLIDKNLLTKKEKKWLDDYHQTVWEKISPLVSGEVKNWLSEATAAL